MPDHTKLLVWQKAHRVALEANRLAITIRGSNYSALRSQIIRAAMSIPANIVEGRAQKGDREFLRFLRYSAASAAELEYHLQLADEAGVVQGKRTDILRDDINEVRRMLQGLMKRLETRAPANSCANS